MPQPVEPHLVEVLKAITESPATLEEIEERYNSQKTPTIKIETSWMHRTGQTLLPNSKASKSGSSREFKDMVRELVERKLVRREVTRYLDGPLDEDTPVYSLRK